jgi:hypothetical protein
MPHSCNARLRRGGEGMPPGGLCETRRNRNAIRDVCQNIVTLFENAIKFSMVVISLREMNIFLVSTGRSAEA